MIRDIEQCTDLGAELIETCEQLVFYSSTIRDNEDVRHSTKHPVNDKIAGLGLRCAMKRTVAAHMLDNRE